MDNLIATLIGGALTLSGTVVAQWFGLFSSKVERQQKHAALQRERLERISDCVAACVGWSQHLLTLKSFDSVRDTPVPKEARQVAMLARIYFPDLVAPSNEYVNTLIEYHCFALGAFRPDAPPGATIGAQMFLNPETKKLESKQLSLRNTLDEAIAREARKYEPSA